MFDRISPICQWMQFSHFSKLNIDLCIALDSVLIPGHRRGACNAMYLLAQTCSVISFIFIAIVKA